MRGSVAVFSVPPWASSSSAPKSCGKPAGNGGVVSACLRLSGSARLPCYLRERRSAGRGPGAAPRRTSGPGRERGDRGAGAAVPPLLSRLRSPAAGGGSRRRGCSSPVPGGSASSTFASLQRWEEKEERAGRGGGFSPFPLFPPFPYSLHSLPSLHPPFLPSPPSAPCGCPARCAPWRGRRPCGGGARAADRCCCCCLRCWRAGPPARRRRCPPPKSLRTAPSSAWSGASCPRAARGPCAPGTSCATTTSAPSPTAPASTPGVTQARCGVWLGTVRGRGGEREAPSASRVCFFCGCAKIVALDGGSVRVPCFSQQCPVGAFRGDQLEAG